MQVYCQYSGITFTVENFANLRLQYVHPIFSAEPKYLLSRSGDWAAQKLNEKECRLLFLSLLYSTDLVEFRTAAVPEHSTVQKNMEQLMRFVAWQSGLTNPAIAFPKFAIGPETRTLGNVKHWLEVWLEARKDFENGYRSTSILARMKTREGALERLIKNAGKKTDDYAGLLATWAMDAADVPASLREYWTSLFKLKGLSVYSAKEVDLEELVEHMEDFLDHGSIYAAATLRHCRKLLGMKKAGLGFSLGMPSEELAHLDYEKLITEPFKIVEDELETYNTDVIVKQAPSEAPQEKDYPTRLAYLRAKAAFTLSQRAKQYADEFTQQVEDVLAADERLNKEISDDSENFSSEDEQQQGQQDGAADET